MLLRIPGPARGRGRGRPLGASRCGFSLSWSPAWLCCLVLAGCQAAWARDLPSSSRPLPPCLEVSRTWSSTWSWRGRGWRLFIALCRSPFPSWEDRGFRLSQGMKLPAPGSWPTEDVWLCWLSGDAFLFALLCFEGSEGLRDALFGVSGLRTWGRGRFQQGEETGEAPRVGFGDPSLHSFSKEPDTATGGFPAPPLRPPLPGFYKPFLPTPLHSAS